MENFLLECYVLLTVLVSFGFVFFFTEYRKKDTGPHAARHICLLLLFAVYIAGVFYVTGAGTVFELGVYGIQLDKAAINLSPFSQGVNSVGYLLNIVLFVPLGLFLPLLWPSMQKLYKAVLFGLGFSLLIELSQLCNARSTDVDDLIMNTLGALVGYLLFLPLAGLMNRRKPNARTGGGEAVLYVAAMFLGHFFLFYEMGMAQLLYAW